MEEWKEYRLKDFMDFNPKIVLKKNTLAKKITMDLLTPHSRDIDKWVIEPYSGGAKFQNGDTIMARITPCLENGKHAFVSCLEEDEVAYGSTEYFVFRGKPGISDNRFVYYLTHSDLFKSTAIKSMVGSSGRQRAQIDVLEDLVMNLPPMQGQVEIAKFLSALDDKIELNNRINHNLHNLAQELFNNNIAENACRSSGWRSASLLDIAEYLNGLAMQKYPAINGEFSLPVLKIKELGQQACDANSDRCTESIPEQFVVKDGDIIFSWSGTLLVDFWCGGKCGLNQHLFKVSSDMYPNWFVYFWTKHHLDRFIRIAKDKAVTMGHIKRGDLGKAEVVIPEDAVMKKLNGEIEPLISECIERRIENRKLQSIRNSLLPKLMSGELKINDLTC